MDTTLDSTQLLVLIVAIRRTISGTEEPPISEILDTNILPYISQIFNMVDTHEDIRHMKVT